MRTRRTIRVAASVVGLAAHVASGCGRVNDGTAVSDALADSTPQTDGTPAESLVDTGVRPDGCPTNYIAVTPCSASELGKICVYDLCKSPTWQILKMVCIKDTVPDPPYPYAWVPENLPCPKDAGTD
jgi:hypothetical protein